MDFLCSTVNAFTTDPAEALPAMLSLPELVRVRRSQNSHEAAHCTTKEAKGLPSVTEWIVTASFVVALWTIERNMKITFWAFTQDNLILELINKSELCGLTKGLLMCTDPCQKCDEILRHENLNVHFRFTCGLQNPLVCVHKYCCCC